MWFAEKKRKDALKKSSVKILGNDVVASWKILIGVFLTPAIVAITSWIFFFTLSKRYASTIIGRLFVQLIFVILFSLYLVLCVQLLNGVHRNFRICMVRFFVILYRNRIKALRQQRVDLKKRVKTLMDKHSQQHELVPIYKRKSLYVDESKLPHDENLEEVFGILKDIVN